jgi:hypothetical protein
MGHTVPVPRPAGRRAPADAGGAYRGPAIEIASVRRTLAALCAGYDTLGPRTVGAAAGAAETAVLRVFGEGGTTPAQEREATVAYGRLLALGARADLDTGRFGRAERRAKLAAMTAVGAGDAPTAARALTTISGALRLTGSPLQALAGSHRARGHAGSGPAAVEALLAEAQACARLHRLGADAVVARVAAAEEEHAKLAPGEQWGTPGYDLTAYHPADLKAYAASALLDVGLYAEAAPRLEEAADLLAGTDGLGGVYVRLLCARASLGDGDLDGALDHAAAAVASAEARPAAWVARIVGELDRACGGSFADLAARAERTTAPPPVGDPFPSAARDVLACRRHGEPVDRPVPPR